MKSSRFLSILACFTLAAALSACSHGATSATGSSPRSDPSPASVTPTPSPTDTTEPPSPTPSPALVSWDQTMRLVQSGVARITMTGCGGAGAIGTGFLVAPNLIVTAAHVVRGAAALAVMVNGQVTSAAVMARNDLQDLALIKTATPIDGYIFSFASSKPDPGTRAAAIGFPEGQPIGISDGLISGLDRQFDTAYGVQKNLVQISVGVNPGNSGGPLVTLDGKVVGVVVSKMANTGGENVENMGYAVEGPVATGMVQPWENLSTTLAPESCGETGTNTNGSFPVYIIGGRDQTTLDIAQQLFAHGQAINLHAYDAGFDQFTPAARAAMKNAEDWGAGLGTSSWTQLTIQRMVVSDASHATATVVQQTRQSAADSKAGQTCSNWTLDYEMQFIGTKWLIGSAVSKDPNDIPAAC